MKKIIEYVLRKSNIGRKMRIFYSLIVPKNVEEDPLRFLNIHFNTEGVPSVLGKGFSSDIVCWATWKLFSNIGLLLSKTQFNLLGILQSSSDLAQNFQTSASFLIMKGPRVPKS